MYLANLENNCFLANLNRISKQKKYINQNYKYKKYLLKVLKSYCVENLYGK